MKESSLMAEAREAGRREGLAEGRKEGCREVIERTLHYKFGETLPDDVRRALNTLDEPQLKGFFQAAFESTSLEDLRLIFVEISTQPDRSRSRVS